MNRRQAVACSAMPPRAPWTGRASSLARALALGIALLAPAAASAQEAGVLRWRGVVEHDATIRFRGDGVQRLGGDEADDRVTVTDALPSSEVLVYVRPLRGHVLVSVDEQPTRDNRYTATVEILSDRREAEPVEIEVLWIRERPGRSDSSWGGGGGGYGHGSGYDRGGAAGGTWRHDDHDGDHHHEYDEATNHDHDPLDDSRLGRSGRPVDRLTWTGVVDGSDYIDLKGGTVTVRHVKNLPIQRMKYDVSSPLPAQPVEMEVIKRDGRGKVRLVNEPSAGNDWTATVLVDDTDGGGSDTYAFDLRWERPKNLRVGSEGKPQDTLTWSGFVDGRDVILVKGNETRLEHQAGNPVRGEKSSFTGPLPSRSIVANVRKLEGRGTVRIEQQPAAGNDFTLRLLIDDPKGSADFYRVELSWEK